jgi:hypothetical protein
VERPVELDSQRTAGSRVTRFIRAFYRLEKKK